MGRFFLGLSDFTRLILFDKRGTGLSDRAVAMPPLEERMDDVRAVMDDAASVRAFGIEVVSELCEKLIRGGAPGLHFYTMNQSALTLEICERLRG